MYVKAFSTVWAISDSQFSSVQLLSCVQLLVTDSLEKTLMLGKIEGKGRRERKRMRRLDGISDFMDISLSRL